MILLTLACATPTRAADALRFERVAAVAQPTAIVSGAGAIWVTEQAGRIWRVTSGAPVAVLDLERRITAGGERGLLGLALAPRFPEDPRVFVNYTHTVGGRLRTRIASFRWRDGRVDPSSEVEILGFDQPYANHNSGALAFGPDGMLYVAVGDGGSGGDPQNHAQDPSDWLGSILRVDVSGTPYAVPPDNPFVGNAGFLPEIWALGVRNPWGMHFDGDTLWFADVGQNAWEEVNRGVRGGNYGWRVTEGATCFNAASCDRTGFVEPVATYGHDVGVSVTGGVVYRGTELPALNGHYLYADFATGVFFGVPTGGGAPRQLDDTDLNPSCFGTDADGRVLVGDYRGTIWRLVK